MKYADIQFFCHASTATPALNRGLAVLATLGEQTPLSLEMLATKLRLPKTSVYRLLGTLQKIGLVRKSPDKRYQALCFLQSVEDEQTLYRQMMEKKMPGLCEATHCTVEWYEPSSEGMRLVHQIAPESELQVRAKPGFLRKWGDEFEAVARLGYAFAKEAPPASRMSMYVANGVRHDLSMEKIRKRLVEAHEKKIAHDTPFNSNGVRRYAAAAFDHTGKTFRGVLALAEAVHFCRHPSSHLLLKQLTQTLKRP